MKYKLMIFGNLFRQGVFLRKNQCLRISQGGKQAMITGICPGSFDPVTLGHLDIINRAAKIFDNVCVVVMVNLNKRCFFTVDERIDFIRRSVAGIPNVSVVHSDKLLAEFSKSMGDCVLVKGLRAISDFEIEFQMALINRKQSKA